MGAGGVGGGGGRDWAREAAEEGPVASDRQRVLTGLVVCVWVLQSVRTGRCRGTPCAAKRVGSASPPVHVCGVWRPSGALGARAVPPYAPSQSSSHCRIAGPPHLPPPAPRLLSPPSGGSHQAPHQRPAPPPPDALGPGPCGPHCWKLAAAGGQGAAGGAGATGAAEGAGAGGEEGGDGDAMEVDGQGEQGLGQGQERQGEGSDGGAGGSGSGGGGAGSDWTPFELSTVRWGIKVRGWGVGTGSGVAGGDAEGCGAGGCCWVERQRAGAWVGREAGT